MLISLEDLKTIPKVSKPQLIWGKLNTQEPHELFETIRLQKIYGNIFMYYRFLANNIYVLSGSEEIAHVHINEHNYSKQYKINSTFSSLLGAGMLLNSGDKYYDRRKNILPLFKMSKLQDYVSKMQQATDRYVDLIIQDIYAQKTNNAIIDIEKYTTYICLDIASLILFGKTWGEDIERAGTIVKYLNENYSASKLQIKTNFQIQKQLNYLKLLIKKKFIDTADEQDKDNLLAYLMNYQGHAQYKYDNKEMLDEIITLLMTGHETSAITVTFALATLTLDSDYKSAVTEEITNLPAELTFKDIQDSHLTRMWLEETMRLFPPVWATMRYNLEHDEINGFYVPAKSYIISNIFALHRNPEYWPKANVFDPCRFTEENKKRQVKNSYMPFIIGPRSCAASNFSMLEIQIIVIRLLQRLSFEKIPGTSLKLTPYMTLRCEPSLKMYVSVRGG